MERPRVHSSTIPPGQGRPIATPPGSQGSGGRALAQPLLTGASTSADARSIRRAVMHRGGIDVAARSSSIPLGVAYRAMRWLVSRVVRLVCLITRGTWVPDANVPYRLRVGGGIAGFMRCVRLAHDCTSL